MNGISCSPWACPPHPGRLRPGRCCRTHPLRPLTKWLTGDPTRREPARRAPHTRFLRVCRLRTCHGGELLRNCTYHKPPKHVADHHPSHSAVWLGQNCLIRPTFTPCNTFSSMAPLANCLATSPNNLVHVVSARRGFKCSAVIPDGPAAAPLRAVRRFFNNKSTSRLKGSFGSTSKREGSIGPLASGGLRVSSCNSF